MSKRDKLYTADWGGLARADYNQYLDNNTIGSSIYAGAKTPEEITEAYKNSTNIFGLAKKDNPFSKGNLAGGPKAMLNTGIGKGIAGAVSGLVGNAAYNALSGGLNSGAGSAISGLGNAIGSAIPNPVIGGLVKIGSGIIGGGINAAIGTSVDEAKLNAANAGTAAYNNFNSNAGTFDDVHTATAQANVEDAYSSGFLNSSWAEERNAELKRKRMEARQWADRSVDNNVNNLVEDQLAASYANSAAFGGLLEQGGDNMGAINYDFMDRYLTNYRDKNAGNDTMTNLFAGTPSTIFAIGGDMQANGADWGTGLMHIDAGKSHEENPYDGVQLGTDNEGVPNLVEEGEVVYDDYVFSNRILLDETAKKKFHFPLKKDITYADAAKKLEKEIEERPNDPISKAGFKAQMEQLEEEQERQKQEMEAARAREAFEALSPEEQTALMQRAAQEEAMAQQAAMQEQAAAQQQASQAMPEGAMMQQPTADAMDTVATPEIIQGGGQTPVMAEGGHLYSGEQEGSSKMQRKKVGTWKDDKQNHWDVFTKPGLKRYIDNIRQRLNMAPDDNTKDAIRREAMNELNALQQSYFDYVRDGAANGTQGYSEDILNHQKRFDSLYGNTGFYSKDDAGNVRNLIAEAINLPEGAATDDKPDKWFDGYNGPRTSIRNFGSTVYGDDKYYQDLVDEFKELGLTYAPNDNWKDDKGTLYGLSLSEVVPEKEVPQRWDWNQMDWVDTTETDKPVVKKEDTEKPKDEEEKKVVPKLRDERLRYLGLLGPAVGLGLQAAGVGRPDTSGLFAAANGAGNVHLAKWKPIGNYLTYNPMDIWFEQNRMDANARATDRAIMNNASPVGTKMAGLLANGYSSLLADGELNRKALEYNDAKKERVEAFNRGTNQYNADAYTRNSQFNAEALNRANQYKAGLLAQAAKEKMNADAGWYQGIYGNISNLFKGFSDLGRENVSHNEVARMWADGIGGVATPKTNVASKYLTYASEDAKGGKIKRKKRGLTC